MRLARGAHVLGALMCLILLAACGGGFSRGGPQVADLRPPPGNLATTDSSVGDALLGGARYTARDPQLDWGVGVLRPSGEDGYAQINLALFDGPGGRHWGWVTQGYVHDLQSRRTLADRSDATVLLGGERAFAVLEARDGGWLQIRYGDAGDRDGGLAWTRADLSTGRRASYVSWARALDGARGLVFRNVEAAHNLRAEPGRDAEIVERLEGSNFDMDALDIQGDWMRVRVNTPPACAGSVAEDLLLGGRESQVQTGWVAWRSDGRGPWVESVAGPRCRGGA